MLGIVDLKLCAARAAKGDVRAFREIVEQTRGPMFRLAARLLAKESDAEDALQEAYVKAFEALRKGRYDGRAKVETWLYRIVTNACVDELRRRKVREATASSSADLAYDGRDHLAARIALAELEKRFADLVPENRAALVLVVLEGLSVSEAAEILESTPGSIEQRLVRARVALREASGRTGTADTRATASTRRAATRVSSETLDAAQDRSNRRFNRQAL